MSEHITVPFSDEQVRALTRWQTCGILHPFTCGGNHAETIEANQLTCCSKLAVSRHVAMTPTRDGWVCPEGCGYIQSWAHDFMADESVIDGLVDQFEAGFR